MKKTSYDSSNITNLQNLKAIRAKPSLYIGATDEYGLFTTYREALDNWVDEALAGRNSYGRVHIDFIKGEYWTLDQGSGIPVGPIIVEGIGGKKHKMSALEAIVSLTHTSGKFDDKAYAASRGSHGLGTKATNALATHFEVWTFSDKSWWHTRYEKGVCKEKVHKVKAPPKLPWLKAPKLGTLVKFVPDPTIFSKLRFPTMLLRDWCRVTMYMTPGLRIAVSITDKRAGKVVNHAKLYEAKDGVKQYVTDKVAELKCAPIGKGTFYLSNALVDTVAVFTDYDGISCEAYTNGLANSDGGVHVDAFYNALKEAIRPFAKTKQNFTVHELKEGCVAIINAKLSSPQFNSQDKKKLVDSRIKGVAEEMIQKQFTVFFKEHPKLARAICERASALKGLKNKFVASKADLKKLANVKKFGLPVSAAISPRAKPEDRELFLVEGASAEGSASSARDKAYQEVLPLKGKILNVLKLGKGKSAFDSEEIINILAMLGFDPKAKDPYSKLRVQGKIICLSDPDPDGPLIGSTLVLLSDGTTKTIRQLAEEWDVNRKPFKVVSINESGSVAIADAVAPRVAVRSKMLVTLHLVNGVQFKTTPDHKWLTDVDDDGTQTYTSSIALNPNDKLYMIEKDRDSYIYKSIVVQQVLANACAETDMYCLTVPEHGNFMVADSLNNGYCSANSHINALELTLFHKYLPELFTRGMVYVSEIPPFFAINPKDKKPIIGKTAEEVEKKAEKMGLGKVVVKHIKGWGEVNSDLVSVLGFNPETRILSKVKPIFGKDVVHFEKLMGDDVESRRLLLGI